MITDTLGPYVILLFALVVAVGLYLTREVPVEVPVPTQFKEVGSGTWMPIKESWVAMSDSDSRYEGGPWATLEDAEGYTKYHPWFLDKYGLQERDVTAPLYINGSWPQLSTCNLMNTQDLLDFWKRNSPNELEYR